MTSEPKTMREGFEQLRHLLAAEKASPGVLSNEQVRGMRKFALEARAKVNEEAMRLGVRNPERMSGEELSDAIERARGRAKLSAAIKLGLQQQRAEKLKHGR